MAENKNLKISGIGEVMNFRIFINITISEFIPTLKGSKGIGYAINVRHDAAFM